MNGTAAVSKAVATVPLQWIHGVPDYIVFAVLAVAVVWFLVKGLAKLISLALWLGLAYFMWRNHGQLGELVQALWAQVMQTLKRFV